MNMVGVQFVERKESANMSYDSDYESVYMVEFESGRTIHVQFFDAEEVKDYCSQHHPDMVIKSIYREVYCNFEECEDA
jgi:hypothetical protein